MGGGQGEGKRGSERETPPQGFRRAVSDAGVDEVIERDRERERGREGETERQREREKERERERER